MSDGLFFDGVLSYFIFCFVRALGPEHEDGQVETGDDGSTE